MNLTSFKPANTSMEWQGIRGIQNMHLSSCCDAAFLMVT